ncbi:MAG TPA: DinB family protein [Bacillota bacterium]|nr:DinB family protein [Bacillota bacterium]
MVNEQIISMWSFTRQRFLEKVEKIDEKDFSLSLNNVSIGDLIYHTADVEYIFMDWFFDKKIEHPFTKDDVTNKEKMIRFLNEANEAFIHVMQQTSENSWQEVISSRMGECTRAEAVARLIYHAGIHSGQMTDILKIAENEPSE